MNTRQLIRGERHHWWPQSLSQFWTNKDGLIGRIDTAGNVSASTPKKTARVSDGHNIRFDGAQWETTFEQYCDRPDATFPGIVEWLVSLVDDHPPSHALRGESIYDAHSCEEDTLKQLCECMVSLVVRSPRFRELILRTIQHVRSDVPKEQHKRLIAMNLGQTYRFLTQDLLGHGKFLVLETKSKEFIFGDGFYNNISPNSMHLFNTRILVPLTPKLAVLYVRPMEYLVEPRLATRRIGDDVVAMVNETVQTHSKECLFFRFDQPVLSDHFLQRQHLRYTNGDPVEKLIAEIPGVRSRFGSP